MSFKKILVTLCLSSSIVNVYAAEFDSTVVAPSCLVNKLTTPFKEIAKTNNLVLLQTNQAGLNDLVKNKNPAHEMCGGFFNVSDAWDNKKNKSIAGAKQFLQTYEMSSASKNIASHSFGINYPKQVNTLYDLLKPQNMMTTLTQLSSFHDRYANSETGVQSAEWVKNQIETMVKLYQRKDITVFTVATKGYKQPSIVVKMGIDSARAAIVLGSHMDSVEADSTGPMPGADDDGSGSVTLMETFRTVLESGMTFKKPIYFIWYAAEEDGLIGSQNVVKYFKQNKISVEYAFNFDMTGYAYEGDRTLYLIRDNTNAELSAYLETLEKNYVKQNVVYTSCGYACSDHATWTKEGYKAAFPFEGKVDWEWHVDPYIHTTNDKMDVLSLDHMTDFAKLALAFVAEAGEVA